MTITQIGYFLTVAKCLNFSEAAKRLYMTQPTLSRQVSAMENELGFPLFHRQKSSISLTAAGQVLYEGLGDFMEQYNAIVEAAMAAHEGKRGEMRIGVLEGHIVGDFLSVILRKLEEDYPDLQIQITREGFSPLIAGLRDRTLDLVFTFSFATQEHSWIDTLELFQSPNYLVVPAGHPKAKWKNPKLKDFEDDVFILNSPHDTEIGFQQAIESFKLAGINPKCKMAQSFSDYSLWIEAGFGVSMLNARSNLIGREALAYFEMPEIVPTTMVLAWNGEILRPQVSLGIEAARQYLADLQEGDGE